MKSQVPYIYSQPNISWKGKTFKQITSSIEKNKVIDKENDLNINLFFKSMPLSIYRKNKVVNTSNCSSANYRISSSIDEINNPGSTIVNNNDNNNGLVNTLDINLPNNLYIPTCLNQDNIECSLTNTNNNNCLSQESNARRRVRSAGMIRKKFLDDGTNNINYCVSANQYLQSRSKSFDRNQYNYIRQGSALVKPGDALSKSNIYTSNNTTQCAKYKLISNVTLQYQWVDGTYNNVTIPAGRYSVEDLNEVLQLTMIKNTHYYININTSTSIFLLNISYNTSNSTIELQSKPANVSIYDSLNYQIPVLPWNTFPSWSTPFVTFFPSFIINDQVICSMLGLPSGIYPPNPITINVGFLNQDPVILPPNQNIYAAISSPFPLLSSKYTQIFYKPSNSQFATQGAVSSSSLITRKKYDTVNDAALKSNNIFNSGTATMNALAYGGPDSTYTVKNKKGFPVKQTPVISKYTGELCKKTASKISNMI